jgi:hypothetical protein
LLKTAAESQNSEELELMKQAGRRDFDLLIAEAADNLERSEAQVKQASLQGAVHFDALMKRAELEGATHFDNFIKQAALEEVAAENSQLQAKLAEYEEYIKQSQEVQYAQIAEAQAAEMQAKLAESVAEVVLNKLKTEMVPNS